MRESRLLLVLLFVALALPGCTGGGGCGEPPRALLDQVMSHAQRDIQTGGFELDRIELVRSSIIDLPQEVSGRKGERLLALTFVPLVKDPVAPGVAFDVTGTLLVDADGEVVGPVDEAASIYFDYPEPREPGWQSRAAKVDDSEQALEVDQCVQR